MFTRQLLPSAVGPIRARPLRSALLPLATLLPLLCCLAASGQEKKKDDEKPKAPAVEDITLRTEDGVQLAITYYAGSRGKETVPVILLHSWKGNRNDFRELAKHLQSLGHAVVIPDLRGHGDSTTLKTETKTDKLKADPLLPAQTRAMVLGDVKRVKEFLWEKNNAEELNLNKLCIVGAELGASVAMEFAVYDWSVPPYGALQLGQFVKAVVLISPEWAFHGLQMKDAMNNDLVRSKMAVLILVGADDKKALAEATRVYKIFEQYHPEPTGENAKAKKTLFFGRLKTSVQGTKMLGVKELNVATHVRTFIDLRLVQSEEAKDEKWQWKPLKYPHQ